MSRAGHARARTFGQRPATAARPGRGHANCLRARGHADSLLPEPHRRALRCARGHGPEGLAAGSLRCSLALQRVMGMLGGVCTDADLKLWRLSVGVHCGEALVAMIGGARCPSTRSSCRRLASSKMRPGDAAVPGDPVCTDDRVAVWGKDPPGGTDCVAGGGRGVEAGATQGRIGRSASAREPATQRPGTDSPVDPPRTPMKALWLSRCWAHAADGGAGVGAARRQDGLGTGRALQGP